MPRFFARAASSGIDASCVNPTRAKFERCTRKSSARGNPSSAAA